MMDFTNGLSFLGDGLAGRDMFREDLEWRIISTPQLPISIIFMQVRNLRELGMALGFESEYTILHQVVERVRDTFSGSEFLAKLSDFEFAILWPTYEHEQQPAGYIEDLHRVLSQPMVVHGTEITLEVCFAASHYPQDGSDAVTLMQHAALAIERIQQTSTEYYQKASMVDTQPLVPMPFHFSLHTIQNISTQRSIGMHVKLHKSIALVQMDTSKAMQYMEVLFREAVLQYKQWLRETKNVAEHCFMMMPLLQAPHLSHTIIDMLTSICYEQKINKESIVLQWGHSDFLGEIGRENQETILFLHEAGFSLAYAALTNEQWGLEYLLEYPFDVFLVNEVVVQQLTNQLPTRKDRLMRAILRSCVEAKLVLIADNWQAAQTMNTVGNLIQHISYAKALPLNKDAMV